ncbi:hypothetical protein DERF_013830 [Dermatophagoides farinae]|uniref:Uncharacterized protein n=1 Tax=Dermatophagoides farinae TaxID=6954 RepID=A0A922HQK6_DERFA|nr:hypothetical protein DERF_013830 [Dermatophagoides farinae]
MDDHEISKSVLRLLVIGDVDEYCGGLVRLDGLSRRYANLGFDGIVLNGVVVIHVESDAKW